jgi:carboxypeptidase family protein
MRLLLAFISCIACAAHAQLSGTVTSSGGENMGGVTVSAKAEGSTIRTSVFTDKAGNYRFTDLPAGKYGVSTQALGYRTAKAEVEIPATARRNFAMQTNADPEQTYRQLPGFATDQAFRHAALQHRFKDVPEGCALAKAPVPIL